MSEAAVPLSHLPPGLSPHVVHFSRIPQGIESDSYVLTFRDSRMAVLKRYKYKSYDDVMSEVELLKTASSSIGCMRPIAISGEQYVAMMKCRPAALYTYMHGQHLDRTKFSLGHMRRVADVLARLHQAFRKYDYRSYWNFQSTIEAARGLLRHDSLRLDNETRMLFDEELNASRTLHLLPQHLTVIHGDLDYGNMIVNDHDHISLIDFDDSSTASFMLDLGILVRNLFLKRNAASFPTYHISTLITQYSLISPYAVLQLGSWTRFACFRYIILMLTRSREYSDYPSHFDDNVLALRRARQLETRLNALT